MTVGTTSAPGAITVNGNTTISGFLSASGKCLAGSCPSDIRLKKNVEPLTGALKKVAELRPVTFEWKNPDDALQRAGTHTGFIAQEVEKVFPQWVGQNDKGFKTLDPERIEAMAMLVGSIQTLKAQNDALQDRVKSLEGGRNRLTSGFSEGGIGLGMFAIAGAIVFASSRRKRAEARS